MKTNLEVIDILKSSKFIDEDGEEYTIEFQDALSDDEINKLADNFPSQTMDLQIKEILKITRGWDGFGMDIVYFDSLDQFGLIDLTPHSLTLGNDGFGNNWVLDIYPDGSLGHVYFACHDPAVFIKHSENLNEFLNHVLEFHKSPSNCHLQDIHEEISFEIWETGGNCMDKLDFLKMNQSFEGFLSKFEGDDWIVCDLRTAKNKEGFAWGKEGPNQQIARHETELIWVIKKRQKGFLSRLFNK
jgi:hypothetical protein